MGDKYEATFHPGEPLPQRDPFATLGSFDRTARPANPIRLDADQAYESPGPPPWTDPDDISVWPLYLVAVLAVATVCGLLSALALSI